MAPAARDRSLTTLFAAPNLPTYPSEHAVAAGAAASILAYIYPTEAARFTALAEEAGRSRLLAGVSYPSDVAAGLELGRKVAAAVIDRAKTDNSDSTWTPPPAAPGVWSDTRPALVPTLGKWKAWVLNRNDQFRSIPPPAFDSAQLKSELEELKKLPQTQPLVYNAYFYASNDGTYNLWYNFMSQKQFESGMAANTPRSARAYALLSIAEMDSLIACWETKFFYMQVRPWQIDPSIPTIFKPTHPSYPSGHACGSSALAEVIAHFFPEEASFIRKKAFDAAESRLTAGIHFRSDAVAGLKMGVDVANAVLERAKSDGADK